ncbi:RNA pyrophosphohydrolase [Candidatus Berkiella cookevillensis]|uniref:RNA pyrophosphohydrolase n=1 Tax=Candidatus Berkiella cookevillensis TaxID=437022 RepID=A0A0Q9YD71_9GAMM|nr:RNA pyrophosphohydrolase [Candidatus Berkiella cookevillensis]MCS5709553.1 RNA pyrophosphohydrolase [Candidatus Berkiella cookevillensis]
MIDEDGFRLNVGIILANKQKKLFWGKRVGQDAWQFPQGGLNENEEVEETLFRELNEEIGLKAKDVSILACSKSWLKYRLPKRLIRLDSTPVCVGQKQKWFLLMLESDAKSIKLDDCVKPEFDDWRWVNFWFPLHQVVAFKREVYRQALLEFYPVINEKRKKIFMLDPIVK